MSCYSNMLVSFSTTGTFLLTAYKNYFLRYLGICTNGYYLPSGGTNNTQCLPCPVGTYKASPSTVCQDCPEGFTTQIEGSSGVAPQQCLREYNCFQLCSTICWQRLIALRNSTLSVAFFLHLIILQFFC